MSPSDEVRAAARVTRLEGNDPLDRARQLTEGLWGVMREARGGELSGWLRAAVERGRGPCTCVVDHDWLTLVVFGSLEVRDGVARQATSGGLHMMPPGWEHDDMSRHLLLAAAWASLVSTLGAWAHERSQRAIPFVDLSTDAFPVAAGLN